MIQQVRKNIVNKMINLPDFINTQRVNDYVTWNDMSLLNDVLLQMVTTKILPIKRIDLICEMFEVEMNNFIDFNNSFLKIIIYYDNLIEYMLEICLENELYEAATNIRNFNQQLTKNNPNVNDGQGL